MSFFIVEVDNDGFKVLDSSGTAIDPATNAVAQAIQSALENIRDTAGIKKIVDALPAGDNAIGRVKLTDGVSVVGIDGSGRLLVSTPPPVPPPGTTPVNRSTIVNTGGTVDDIYTITNGKTLTITRFSGGAEGGKQSKVTLFEDPNGNLSVLNIIRLAYVSGTNFDFALDAKFTGNGTRRIVMRLERLDGGAKEIAGFWDGFEQ